MVCHHNGTSAPTRSPRSLASVATSRAILLAVQLWIAYRQDRKIHAELLEATCWKTAHLTNTLYLIYRPATIMASREQEEARGPAHHQPIALIPVFSRILLMFPILPQYWPQSSGWQFHSWSQTLSLNIRCHFALFTSSCQR